MITNTIINQMQESKNENYYRCCRDLPFFAVPLMLQIIAIQNTMN